MMFLPIVVPWKKIAVNLVLFLATKIPVAVYGKLCKAYLKKRWKGVKKALSEVMPDGSQVVGDIA